MQSFKPKTQKKNLTPKIDKLLEKGKELGSHAQQLGDKANSLKSRYEEISESFEACRAKPISG
ncbi:MAG: hypothetical protein IPG32_01620 [Saprospirales bacterium]|nr:hypothetical protein [Saprospirales bacterium]